MGLVPAFSICRVLIPLGLSLVAGAGLCVLMALKQSQRKRSSSGKPIVFQNGQSECQQDQSEWRESERDWAAGGASGGAGGGRGGGGGGGGRRHEDEEESHEDESSDSNEEQPKRKRKKLWMALINVRSVSKKSIKEGRLIRKLILDHDLNFFLITETWLKPGQEGDKVLSSLLPPNRNFIHQPRGFGRGGGVAIVYSDQFQCRPVTLPGISTFECVAGSVRHETWDRPVLIIMVYHPTARNKDEFRDFVFELTLLLSDMSKEYSSIILAGDFNIWIDIKKRRGPQFLQILNQNNLDQFVHEPTHQGGHILDLVVGREMDITIVEIQDDDISDHYTVYFNARPKKKKKKR